MTEVWIRNDLDDVGYKLGEVPLSADGIEGAYDLVKSWGVMLGQADTTVECGQFRTDGTRAYFEIILAT